MRGTRQHSFAHAMRLFSKGKVLSNAILVVILLNTVLLCLQTSPFLNLNYGESGKAKETVVRRHVESRGAAEFLLCVRGVVRRVSRTWHQGTDQQAYNDASYHADTGIQDTT